MKKLILILVFLLSLPGYTVKAKEKIELGKIVVTPSRIKDKWLNYPDSATLLKSTKSVDVIDLAQIERSEAQNVPELLKSQAGILVSDYFGHGKSAQVDIRGFGTGAASNVLVMIDGRRANQNDLSGADWANIDIDTIEKIEIVRGPQSVLYGDNAVGGVINIITKRGKAVEPKLKFSHEAGSWRYSSYALSMMGGAEFLDYFINASTARTTGFRTNSDLETIGLTNTFTLKPVDYLDIRIDASYHKDWYDLPGNLTDRQIDAHGMQASDNPDNRVKTEDYHLLTGLDLSESGEWGNLTLTADVIARNRRTSAIYHASWAGAPAFQDNSRIETLGVTPRLAFESAILDIPNRTIVGVDYYKYRNTRLSGNYRAPKDFIVIDEQSMGVYATESLELTPALSISGGGRLEWAKYDFDQRTVLPEIAERTPFEYAFEAGANYKYNERSALYANAARSFRLPVVDEWYVGRWAGWGGTGGGLNLDLAPQTGMNYEVGIRDNTLKPLKVTANYFLMDLEDEIFYDPWVSGVNAVYDRTFRHGMEFEAHSSSLENLDIYCRYTYQKAFFVGSHYAGNEIPMVPRHKLAWGINYTFMDSFDINYLATLVGERRFISDQQNIMRKMKRYFVNDLVFAYHKFGFRASFAVKNLLDYKYSAIGSYGQYYPSPGRSFVIGFDYEF